MAKQRGTDLIIILVLLSFCSCASMFSFKRGENHSLEKGPEGIAMRYVPYICLSGTKRKENITANLPLLIMNKINMLNRLIRLV